MRISVTTLDRFREYLEEQEADKAEDMLAGLLRYVKNEPPPTAAMRRGTAIHKVCEHPSIVPALSVSDALVEVDDFQFYAGDLRKILRELPLIRRNEVPFSTKMFGEDFDVTVSGKIDILDATAGIAYDIKTRGRKSGEVRPFDEQRDFDKQLDSSQWKFYTIANGLQQFRYLVLNFTNVVPMTLISINRYDCQPYAGMYEELNGIVCACAEWIISSNLQQYFKDK